MSLEITTAFVEQYSANVDHLSQQKGSKLRGTVETERVVGKSAFFEQLGQVAARRRTSRHSDTPRMDTPHLRRRVSMFDYDWADLVDKEDEIRMLIDPASKYAQAAAWAMGRAMDDEIILAATSVAYTGVDGSTQTAFDTGMIVDVQVRDIGVGAADLGLNTAKLLEAQNLLGQKEVDPDEPRTLVVNARQAKSLLSSTKVQSFDYNTLKPLLDGKIVRWGGFDIVMTERIKTDSNGDDMVLYYVKSGIKLGMGREPMSRIGERADKNYATQVFYSMTLGATRMEEAKVGYIECDPTAGPGA